MATRTPAGSFERACSTSSCLWAIQRTWPRMAEAIVAPRIVFPAPHGATMQIARLPSR